ncbi:MAG: hypothetical protein AVDCRST_MAG59-2955 [uncultured Thermomicrobiales bacterium]|uniref:Uncharacterized protein n=1 Tax=uncultured Thermomicrobiales bacterium TaxID=1645740 RepID=A0A6J4V1E2_9BACT|nr:MAG: hypothetical protein AVDCRST_MAG59-2955 [uncultured Thermomicrobiales bacterium]
MAVREVCGNDDKAFQGGGPEAVVEVGGFPGIGEREITIPLGQIRTQDDRLTTSVTRGSIGAARPYERGRYQDWDRTRTFGGTARQVPSWARQGRPRPS